MHHWKSFLTLGNLRIKSHSLREIWSQVPEFGSQLCSDFCSDAGMLAQHTCETEETELLRGNAKWRTRTNTLLTVKAGFPAPIVSTALILQIFWSLHKANCLHFHGQCSVVVLWCSKGSSGKRDEMSDCGFYPLFRGIHACLLCRPCPGLAGNQTSNFGCAWAAAQLIRWLSCSSSRFSCAWSSAFKPLARSSTCCPCLGGFCQWSLGQDPLWEWWAYKGP